MKANALFFLLIFSVFIVTPTVINLCDNEANIVGIFLGEEENTDTSLADSEHYVITHHMICNTDSSSSLKMIPTISLLSYWDTWYPDTFSPPPEALLL